MVTEPDNMIPGTADLQEQEAMWRILHHLLRPPAAEQWEWLTTEPVRSAWSILAGRCALEHRTMPIPSDYDSYQEQFLATFDVGMPHPPCPLLESHWNRKESPGLVRQRNMRFYEQFGLQLRSADGSPPDHLRHQLELLEYLCRLELDRTLCSDADEASQLARARHEYLTLHLLSWVPAAARDLAAKIPGAWPSRWMELLAACLEGEETAWVPPSGSDGHVAPTATAR